MIRLSKEYIRKLLSIYKLKSSKCVIRQRIPFIDPSAKIYNNKDIIFKGHTVIEENVVFKNKNGVIELDDKPYIRRFSKIQNLNGVLQIGSNTTVNEFTIIQANEGSIKIGNDVRIAPYVKIFAENHIFKDINIPIHKQGLSSQGIEIGNNVWIGTGSIILDGVSIGDNVVIGAGSVVTKNIESNKVAAGNPAKVIKDTYSE